MAFGSLLTWILGYFLSWRMIAWILIIPPTILILLLIWLPESPYWLIEHDKMDESLSVLHFDFAMSFSAEYRHEVQSVL